MICEESFLEKAILALKANHPYEEPAFEFYLINFPPPQNHESIET